MMENTHPLKVVLQLHLATDISAAQNLPYVLDALSPQSLAPSSHLPKWTARVNSLMHSKEVHARWAGLCLAHRTSMLARSLMIENAQSWLGVALPNLSRKDTAQVLTASINLCRIIFCSAADVPEFQRQICIPNVPKFTAALLALSDGPECDRELKVLILRTLTKTVSSYPTLHRVSHTSLSALCLKLLDGSSPTPTHPDILHSASRLYASLSVTGGKVGATNLWRKSLDETLVFGWSSYHFLQNALSQSVNAPQIEHPHISLPLSVDRLRCCMTVIDDLFGADIQRPVQLPVGPLVAFCTALLTLNNDERKTTQTTEYFDVNTQIIASTLMPDVWNAGCTLLSTISTHARHHLSPHSNRLGSCLIYHLERTDTYGNRMPFLKALDSLLGHILPLHSDATCNRIARGMIPLISVILPLQAELETKDTAQQGKSKRKKKRGAGFEGDEVFKTSRDVIFPLADDGEVVLTALHVLQVILRNASISLATHSICFRVLLSVLLFLPQRSPAAISPDATLHRRLLLRVQEVATEVASGTTNTMSKSLAVVLKAAGSNSNVSDTSRLTFDLLLHPRVPPLVRSMPHVETLSLFHAEESTEEASIRESFGLAAVPSEARIAPAEDEDMAALAAATISPAPVPAPAPAPSVHAKPATFASPKAFNAKPDVDVPMTASVPPMKSQTFKPPPPVRPSPVAKPVVAEPEEDEEMPSIDMDSDSD